MSEKRSKYDTDPLDPDFVRRTDEMWGATRGAEQRPTGDASSEQETALLPGTQPAAEPPRADERPSDAPTQRMDEHFSRSYPSVFIPPNYQQPPVPYQQPPPPYQQQPYQQAPPTYQQPYVPPPGTASERVVAGFNVKEKWAVMLPYTPFYIGLVFALIELLTVPRQETRVRFHAAQALALHLAIILGGWLFTILRGMTGSGFGGFLFWLASFIFLLVSMSRVWKGEEHRIGPLAEPTRWLNEHINVRKS
jgi:uncharacterized membrane protein